MDIVGFVHISNKATTCKGAENPNEFIGKVCAVMEFGFDDSVLVLNPQKTALAMFDKGDVYRSFKCSYSNGIVCPVSENPIEQMLYVSKCLTRKGGYNHILMNMVIQASLMKGKFYDAFLWQLQ